MEKAESAAAQSPGLLSVVVNTWVWVDLVRRGTDGVLVESVEQARMAFEFHLLPEKELEFEAAIRFPHSFRHTC